MKMEYRVISFFHESCRKEFCDLLDNGYNFLFNSSINGANYIKLRHQCNGRTLFIVEDNRKWLIREKGKTLKEVKPAL